MLIEKTSLEKKFNTITGVASGYILKFDNNGNIVPVDPTKEGLHAQIKVSGSQSVDVIPSANIVNQYTNSEFNYTIININTLNVQYTVTVNNTNYYVTPTEYRQYVVSIS